MFLFHWITGWDSLNSYYLLYLNDSQSSSDEIKNNNKYKYEYFDRIDKLKKNKWSFWENKQIRYSRIFDPTDRIVYFEIQFHEPFFVEERQLQKIYTQLCQKFFFYNL